MMPRLLPALLAVAACSPPDDVAAPAPANVAAVEAPQPLSDDWAAWNAPVAPFRIADNLFYVGAANVSAYAVKTPEGVILIDTGFAQTAPQVEANLRGLGFGPADVKIILTSHAHADHVGGVAAMKAATGARLVASAADAELMSRGGRQDFTWGDDLAYPAVTADRIVADGEAVTLGGATLTAHITPGHTKGCTTWTMRADVGGTPRDVVFLCGTTAPGYDLIDNAAYPVIAEDFARSFATMAALPCDIALVGHVQGIGFVEKAAMRRADAFVDPAGCREYIADARAAFDKELARQRAGGAPKKM